MNEDMIDDQLRYKLPCRIHSDMETYRHLVSEYDYKVRISGGPCGKQINRAIRRKFFQVQTSAVAGGKQRIGQYFPGKKSGVDEQKLMRGEPLEWAQ